MTEMNFNNESTGMDIADILILLWSESKKIFIFLLISLMSWLIYYNLHTVKYESSIYVTPTKNITFAFDKITSDYLLEIKLSAKDIALQFQSNALNYNNFDNFFNNQEFFETEYLDIFYSSFSIEQINETFKYSIIFDSLTPTSVERFLLGYLDEIDRLTLKNILSILSKEIKSLQEDIITNQLEDKLIKDMVKKNNNYLLEINELKETLELSKYISVIEENLLIANELGYDDPVGNIESLLISSLGPIENNESDQNEKLPIKLNKSNSASHEKPLFFLGQKILRKYLEILNDNLLKVNENLSQNYPDLYISVNYENELYDQEYIEKIAKFSSLEAKLEKVKESFRSMGNKPKLVDYNIKKVNTSNIATSYMISFSIAVALGLLFGMCFVIGQSMISKKLSSKRN